MSTLEKRVEALERMVPAFNAKQTTALQELEARMYDQIDALRQQLAEQQRRLSKQEQNMQQKFETLTNVILQQSQAISQQFGAINTRFDALEVNTKARFETLIAAIRVQFENTNVPLTMLTTTVNRQGQDIRALKSDVSIIKEQLAEVKQDNTAFYSRFDRLERGLATTNQQVDEVRQEMNGRFEQVDQQIADVRQEMNGRFEQVDKRFEATNQQITEVRQEVTEVRQEMNGRFEQVDKRFDTQDTKFDQVLQQLAAITVKLDQGR